MTNLALDTMARADKGRMQPPPVLEGALAEVAAAVSGWPCVAATTHWDLFDPSRVDGADFYVGQHELGHLHLDGSLHLATSPDLGAAMVAEKLARPFRYGRGWVCETVGGIGAAAAIALFRRNYDRLLPLAGAASAAPDRVQPERQAARTA